MSPLAITLKGRSHVGSVLSNFHGIEWIALAALTIVDVIWARHIGLRVIVGWQDFAAPLAVFAAGTGFYLFGRKRGGLIAEYLALSVCMALAFTVFSYLALASSGPLVDRQLLAADRALGFDWLAEFKQIAAHPVIANAMALLYNSLGIQALYVCIFLGMLRREHALRELFWLIFLSALITDLGTIAFPAYGPFEVFNLSSHGGFLPDMKHLKSGKELTFALGKMTGVVCFPSFHTVMALAYAYAVRRTGAIGYALAGANFAMLFAIPFCGGHYLVDMIAGAGVLLFSLGALKAAKLWLTTQPGPEPVFMPLA